MLSMTGVTRSPSSKKEKGKKEKRKETGFRKFQSGFQEIPVSQILTVSSQFPVTILVEELRGWDLVCWSQIHDTMYVFSLF